MIQALIVSPYPWPWRFLLTKMNDFNIQFIHWITKWKYTMYIQCKAAFCTCLFIFSDKWFKKMTKAFLCKCIYSRSTMKWSFIHIPKIGTNKKELQWTWFWEFFSVLMAKCTFQERRQLLPLFSLWTINTEVICYK